MVNRWHKRLTNIIAIVPIAQIHLGKLPSDHNPDKGAFGESLTWIEVSTTMFWTAGRNSPLWDLCTNLDCRCTSLMKGVATNGLVLVVVGITHNSFW